MMEDGGWMILDAGSVKSVLTTNWKKYGINEIFFLYFVLR